MFPVKENPKLSNTSRVIIQTNKPAVWSSTTAIHMRLDNKEGVAYLDSIIPGPDCIIVDKNLFLFLNATTGSLLEIEPWKELNDAVEAVIVIPSNWLGTVVENTITRALISKPFAAGQQLVIPTLKGNEFVTISKIKPALFAVITEKTKISFEARKESSKKSHTGVHYTDIGALKPVIDKIRELIEFPLRLPEAMKALGIEPPRGILLHGPPRTGKTLIAKALANELGIEYIPIQGPEILSAYFSKSENNLRDKFNEARKKAPSLIVIDEIDSIAPKRDSLRGETELRIVSTLLTEMDGLKDTKGVLVVGTTNRPNAIDPALRAPGRLEYELYIGIPNVQGRKEILEIHTRTMPLAKGIKDAGLGELAEKTHGFVGGDLAFLCREAGYGAFRRYFNNPESRIKKEEISLSSLEVNMDDFKKALETIHPSALRELLVSIPKDVTWEKIGGLREVKTVIQENVIQGIKNPQVLKDEGIKPAKGILLYGSPGTGKTMVAKALANECDANFISVKGPQLRSKWFGESEEKVRFIFETARKATPCIIFLDEVDSMAPVRGKDASGLTDSIVNQLLSEMDGVESIDGVFVVGATNRLELIDEAMLRPGRFDYQIRIPLPDAESRQQIFMIHLKKGIIGEDVDMDDIVKKTEGFSGAEIAEACRLAGLRALREVDFKMVNKIRMKHFRTAIVDIQQRREKPENENPRKIV
jgi:transitional endoplasmic reticulum ATPase